MKQNKFSVVAITLLLIAFSATSWVTPKHRSHPSDVTITAVYDFSTFPHVTGTFTTTGAFTITGTSTMYVVPNQNGIRAHCDVVLYPSGGGTIIIDQECEFAGTAPWRGQWQIVSGTGAYANLHGNGSLTMPPNTEAMTGVIY